MLGMLALAWLLTALAAVSVQAQSRNAFPGRRIGGGTRGECAARQIIHLVPESSVYTPGATRLIAWLEGPTSDPRPLQLTLRQQDAAVFSRTMETGGGPRLVLFSVPATVAFPLVWESSYQCADAPAADEFGFLGVEAPPAKSLLLKESVSGEAMLSPQLEALQANCGSSIPLQPLAAAFGLEDLISSQWPEMIPVVCR
ncbi:putative conserved secreted protein [Synechococcus sp. RS9909]|nr:putative conserved secreted protein [Synechococcus sp. RS9909]